MIASVFRKRGAGGKAGRAFRLHPAARCATIGQEPVAQSARPATHFGKGAGRMVIGVIGENCSGKSTLADMMGASLPAEIVTGKDYLRMAK